VWKRERIKQSWSLHFNLLPELLKTVLWRGSGSVRGDCRRASGDGRIWRCLLWVLLHIATKPEKGTELWSCWAWVHGLAGLAQICTAAKSVVCQFTTRHQATYTANAERDFHQISAEFIAWSVTTSTAWLVCLCVVTKDGCLLHFRHSYKDAIRVNNASKDVAVLSLAQHVPTVDFMPKKNSTRFNDNIFAALVNSRITSFNSDMERLWLAFATAFIASICRQ